MGAFVKDRVPDWQAYADSNGMVLEGKGLWRNVLCSFHADTTPSMRVNLKSGGWICMSCGVKGGDVLGHHMERTGDGFVEAAKALGAWDEGQPWGQPYKAPKLAARDALQAIAHGLRVVVVVLADARKGALPSSEDWSAFVRHAGNLEWLAAEFGS